MSEDMISGQANISEKMSLLMNLNEEDMNDAGPLTPATTFIDPKTKIIVRPLSENAGYEFFVIGIPQNMDLSSLRNQSPADESQ